MNQIGRHLFLTVLLSLILMSFAVSAQEKDPVTVTFTAKKRSVGERFKRRTYTKFVMRSGENTDVDKKDDIYLKSIESITRFSEVLERNTDGVTAVKVRCLKHSKTVGVEEAKTSKSPVAGKTIFMKKKGKVISILDSSGKECPETVKTFAIEKFTGDFYDFESAFFKALNKGQATIGKTIEVDAKIGHEMFRDDDPSPTVFKVQSMSLTLKSVNESGIARFEAKVRFVSFTKEAPTTQLLLKGLVDVDRATCRLKMFDFKGPVSFLGESGANSSSRGIVIYRETLKDLPRIEKN